MNNKPNIIFIITDQQRSDTIRAAGYDWMITPELDKLTQDSVTFTNNFSCGAACVCSRAALFTGMYPHNNGVYNNENKWDHHRTWLHDFRGNGYYVVNVGKMHHRNAPMAFHERYIVENKSSHLNYDLWNRFLWIHGKDVPKRYQVIPDWEERLNTDIWPMEEQYYSDIFVGDLAINFIQRWEREEPLFLQIGFPGPHEPYDAPERFVKMYEDKNVKQPIFKQGELEQKPPAQKFLQDKFASSQHENRINFKNATADDYSRMRRHYFANVTAIDEKVGQIVQVLEQKGMLENSIIVFTSDHGDHLGDHGLPYKWTMYDSVTRVPLIIKTPETKGHGRIDKDLFSQIDLGPTLLRLVDIPIPSYLDGTQRVERIEKSNNLDKPDAVFAEENFVTMIRTDKYKMVYYVDQRYGELYDLEKDPQELDDLYFQDAYQSIQADLKNQLLNWIVKSSYFSSGYKNKAGLEYEVKLKKMF